jgi:DNA-binding CsgD family transcriptional regulator
MDEADQPALPRSVRISSRLTDSSGAKLPDPAAGIEATNAILQALAATASREGLADLMKAITHELGFSHYALIHHDDLRGEPTGRVDIKDYPAATSERIIDRCMWRRDPIVRACIFADAAFLWSNLAGIIQLDRRDRESLAHGVSEGLNEGITVPCVVLGQCMGSCTFAGTRRPEHAGRFLGMAQMIGVFAFQAAKRIVGYIPTCPSPARLHPRPRDCVVLVGRGLSNKQIARALSLTPRTVDGYLTEARQQFRANDRTELVVSAVLAGEISLHEITRSQPE